ncbi:MAG: isocitrate lyase/phosphoenolpyruvate mutase family protein, partial [Gemmataceae bacterium]
SGKSLIAPLEMATKLRAAVAARRDADFVIIARTDARNVEGLDAAIERGRLYVQAGADALFPEALSNAEEFAQFARAVPGVPLLANMTEFGQSPLLDRDELAVLGYRMVLYPVSGLRAALAATRAVFEDLWLKGHQRDRVEQMLTRRELYDLLDYDGYDARDRAYFG